jgi:hypothetical protein
MIGLREQLMELVRRIDRLDPFRQIPVVLSPEADDAHPQSVGFSGKSLADGTESDDPERLPGELKDVAFAMHPAVANLTAHESEKVAGEDEHHPYQVLWDVVDVDAAEVRKDDIALNEFREEHCVDAGAGCVHPTEIRRMSQEFGVKEASADHRLGSGQGGDQCGTFGADDDFDIGVRGANALDEVRRHAVVDNEFVQLGQRDSPS